MSNLKSAQTTRDNAIFKVRRLAKHYDPEIIESLFWGEWDDIEITGHQLQPKFAYGPSLKSFLQTCVKDGWIIKTLDCHSWTVTPECKALFNDFSALADASPRQIAMMLTVIWFREAQENGYIDQITKSGLLLAILNRVWVLARTLKTSDDDWTSNLLQ